MSALALLAIHQAPLVARRVKCKHKQMVKKLRNQPWHEHLALQIVYNWKQSSSQLHPFPSLDAENCSLTFPAYVYLTLWNTEKLMSCHVL